MQFLRVVTALLLACVIYAAATSYRTLEVLPPAASFGGVSLRIEVASTTAARARGLSGRGSLPPDYGMLFIFEKSDTYGIWMKDMLIPIDIFWLDDAGRVVSFTEFAKPESYPRVFYPLAPARYVLETAAGFASMNAIATGTQLELQKVRDISK